MINWQLSKQGIRWPVSLDRTAGSSVHPSRSSVFWSYPLTNYQFQLIAGSSLFFPMIHMKYVVFMSLWPRTVKILISNWPPTWKFSQFFESTGGEYLFLPWSRVCHALRPIFMLWLDKIWEVSSCGKFIQHLESCLFPLDLQNEIQQLSRVFCYSWLVCLLGFWLRNASLVKIR